MLRFSACSGDDSSSPTNTDAGTPDTSTPDTSTSSPDTSVADSTPPIDSPGTDTGVAAACPAAWTIAPVVDAPIALPDGGGGVILHASGVGTQDYTCSAVIVDGGAGFAWVFNGPEADLEDCAMTKIGKHFANDAGPGAPEWMTLSDGTYVIGKKVGSDTPDGGGGSIPWLLLQATEHGGGTGTLNGADYIQRVNTSGGKAPTTTCDTTTMGTTQKVPYTADYYFFGM